MSENDDDILLGAHTSSAGGVFNALSQGEEIGATTIQLFTANQRQWTPKELTEDIIQKWHTALKETALQKIMSHASYLINLGCPNKENLLKSRTAFKKECERCIALGVSFLNFHPGAALKESVELCLDTIIESLLQVEELIVDSPTRLLLETTAGQGSNVGWKFEELAYIIKGVEKKIPIGVCIDTCHIFAAGYDLRTEEACDATMKEFDQVIGLENLYGFHLNDSLKPFASRRDRHAKIGEGDIGLTCFEFLMNDKRTRHLPKYLETPGGSEQWKKEIKMLRKLVKVRS